MTSDSANDFKFNDGERNVGPEDFYNLLRKEVGNSATIKLNWVKNHYRFIVWKLASMERVFPQDYGGNLLTPDRVLSQLKYRCEIEIFQSKRPAIRKILEQDESSARLIVVVVTAIRFTGTSSDPTGHPSDDHSLGIIEISDGWYSINAQLDEKLTELLNKGKIYEGLKLRIASSVVIGSGRAQSPLDITDSTMLGIHVNGVRRQRWWAKLGFQRQSSLVIAIKSIDKDGGIVPCIDVLIERAYPVLYLVSHKEGKTVLTARGEDNASNKFSAQLMEKRQALAEQIRKDIEEDARDDARAYLKNSDLDELEKLYYEMISSDDPGYYLSYVSPHLQGRLKKKFDSFHQNQMNKISQQIEKEIREDPDLSRDVRPFLRLKIRDYPTVKRPKTMCAYLTIWNPTSELIDDLKEGKRFRIFNTTPDSRNQDFSNAPTLNSSNNTRYELVRCETCVYDERRFYNIPASKIRFGTGKDEFDFIGVIIIAGTRKEVDNGKISQSLFLTDASEEIIAVDITLQPEDFPSQNALKMGKVVAFSNLKYLQYDENQNYHTASATNQCEFFFKPKRNMKKNFNELQDWLEKSHGTIESLSTTLKQKHFSTTTTL
eukprot:TRINITY_DN6781_c0_g2_i1.p1 TRINITY_DN6781_c0_g2~~TRINITY_DN6781_c0_g2_i1.p1  ORF type:complete len:602 (-),score=94.02 TRINITY_DN6781_c0_g2_i1:917-2722(-)